MKPAWKLSLAGFLFYRAGANQVVELAKQFTRSAMALPFQSVDVAAQARAYKLEQSGAKDGAANRPETISKLPALAEQEIMTAVEAERDRCLVDLAAHLRAERDALAQLQTAMDIAGMRQGAGEAISDFIAIRAVHDSNLMSLEQASRSASAEYEQFRVRNRLIRAARQPDNRAWSLSLMAFMIVMEGVVNAVFFASGSDSGLLGGAVLAAAFSAVNVGLGALNGLFPLRWTHHGNPAIRLAGLAFFPAFLTASLALNAFIAHYRDVAQTAPETDPVAVAYANLVLHPLGLRSIESWLLFALGMACAGYAVAKGFAFDDPHPSYGAYDRRRAATKQAFEDARRDLIDQASGVRDQFTGEIREKIETLRGSSSQRQQLLASRSRNLSEFQAHEAHLVHAAQQLLSIYRRANQAVRSTPPPAHFGQAFAFPDHALDRLAIRALLEDQGLEIDAERLIQELDDLRRDVLGQYAELLRASPARVPA